MKQGVRIASPRSTDRIPMRRVFPFANVVLAVVMSTNLAIGLPSPVDASLSQTQPVQNVFTLAVTDPSDAVIPNAAVTIVNEKTGTKADAQTDAEGQLRLVDFHSGIYEITVNRPGFKTLKLTHVAAPTRDKLKLQLEFDTGMMEPPLVADVHQDTEPSPLPSELVEPPPSQSSITTSPHHQRDVFRRFFSALRRLL
jgi:hypothetical protein